MFLDGVRELGLLTCIHPNSSFDAVSSDDGGDEWIRCAGCEKIVLSVRNFLCELASPFDSPTLAREYAEWTGHVEVPCRFSTKSLKSRVLPRRVPSKFSTLHRGYRLLRAIHSPFFGARGEEAVGTAARPPGVDPKLFRNLMTEYLSLIDRVSDTCERENTAAAAAGSPTTKRQANSSPSEAATLKAILTNMKNVFADVDIYEQYFDVLVPYVKSADRNVVRPSNSNSSSSPLRPDDDGTAAAAAAAAAAATFPGGDDGEESDRPFGPALERELERSSRIHERFSRFCVPFEVVHVMVLCYLCGEDTETTYNLVLDMAAKLCTGYFSFPVSRAFEVGHQIRNFLERNVTPTNNLQLYYLLNAICKDDDQMADCIDEKFLRKYGLLEGEIRKRVPAAAEDGSKLDRFVYQQTFPYLLFESHANDSRYYAFVMALAHYVSKSHAIGSTSSGVPSLKKCKRNAGANPVPAGVVADCKKIYRFVRECISRVRTFNAVDKCFEQVSRVREEESRRAMYWTKDMFNLFLASNADLGEGLANVLVLMT